MGGERLQRTETESRERTIPVEGWEGPQRWGTRGRPKQPAIHYTIRSRETEKNKWMRLADSQGRRVRMLCPSPPHPQGSLFRDSEKGNERAGGEIYSSFPQSPSETAHPAQFAFQKFPQKYSFQQKRLTLKGLEL